MGGEGWGKLTSVSRSEEEGEEFVGEEGKRAVSGSIGGRWEGRM